MYRLIALITLALFHLKAFAGETSCSGPVQSVLVHTDGRLFIQIGELPSTAYCHLKQSFNNVTTEQCSDLKGIATTSQTTGKSLVIWFQNASNMRCRDYVTACDGGSWCLLKRRVNMYGLK